MVNQPVWIGIVIGVFFVGIGISYAIFEANNPSKFMALTPQQMIQMMNDPQTQQMMNQMMQNPQFQQQMMEQMNIMMNDPELRQQMMTMMMQNPQMMQAMMGNQQMMGMMDTKSNFPSSELQQEKSNLENEFDSCTSDWYITGYFQPIESDYSGELVEISVNEVKQFYLADFLEVVKIEGWGRTNAGNYLGWYHDSYHIGDTSLDALGNDLVVGMIAVDTSLIEHGSELIIPTLPAPWDNMVFSASDVGPSIIGKHIDVFTGEGINAENETFRITGTENEVCLVTLEDNQ